MGKLLSLELIKRTAVAIPLLALVVYAFQKSPLLFYLILTLATSACIYELISMHLSKYKGCGARFILVMLVFAIMPSSSVLHLYQTRPDLLAWATLNVWATDIGAYFVGKKFGTAKIVPKISPGKSWQGLAGGLLTSAMVNLGWVANSLDYRYVLWGVVVSVLSQISDLTESALKRHYGVKDSGKLLPGHGGVLDRVDGFILTAPFCIFLSLSL